MDVFGTLEFKTYQKPQKQDFSQKELQEITDTAQSAFTKAGVPTRRDVEEHIIPVSNVVLAKHDGKIVGFSSTQKFEDQIYANGLAIDQDYQRAGIGTNLRLKGVLNELENYSDDENIVVSTRTQNPAVLGYMQEYFDAHPRREEEAPENISESLEELAKELDPTTKYNEPIMKEAYQGSMYEQLPDHELQEFIVEDLELNYENGDALLVGGEVKVQEIKQSYDNFLQNLDYEIDSSS